MSPDGSQPDQVEEAIGKITKLLTGESPDEVRRAFREFLAAHSFTEGETEKTAAGFRDALRKTLEGPSLTEERMPQAVHLPPAAESPTHLSEDEDPFAQKASPENTQRRKTWASLLDWAEASGPPALLGESHDFFVEKLTRSLLTDKPHLIALAKRYLKAKHFKQYLELGPITEGYPGGKSLGLMLAFAALEKDTPTFDRDYMAARYGVRPADICLEGYVVKNKDSVPIGTGIFDRIMEAPENRAILEKIEALVERYKKQTEPSTKLAESEEYPDTTTPKPDEDRETDEVPDQAHEEIKAAVLKAHIPDEAKALLREVFDRFHGSPFIDRSSGLLEDDVKASFAGCYDSPIFGRFTGDSEADFEKFLENVLTVYASTYSKRALEFRRDKSLLDLGEKMAITTQVLNGKEHDGLLYPDISGVVASYSPDKTYGTDPTRGQVRLACGLGSIIVDKGGGRIINFEKPAATHGEKSRPMQTEMLVLDTKTGEIVKISSSEILQGRHSPGLNWAKGSGMPYFTFELIENSRFIRRLEYLAQKLKYLLGYEVLLEITAQYDEEKDDWITTLVQCRPLDIPEHQKPARMPESIPQKHILIDSKKTAEVGLCLSDIQKVLFIDPSMFSKDGTNVTTAQERSRNLEGIIRKICAALGKNTFIIIAPGGFGKKEEDGDGGIRIRPSSYKNTKAVVELTSGGLEAARATHDQEILRNMGIIFGTAHVRDVENFLQEAPSWNGWTEVEAEIRKGRGDQGLIDRLIAHIKVIDIEKACAELGLGENMVANLAQDPTSEDRRTSLYVAPKDENTPIPIE